MNVIQLSAIRPQSGKDTLANLVVDHLTKEGKTAKVIAFGDALRKHVANMFDHIPQPITEAKLLCSDKDIVSADYSLANVRGAYYPYVDFMTETKDFDIDEPRSLRFHMQHYGTDFVRDYMGLPNHWIDQVTRQIDIWESMGVDTVIVTDTRFPAEYDTLKFEFCALSLLVSPVGFPKSNYQKEGREVHKAESFSKDFDYDFEVFNQYGFKEAMLQQMLNIF